MSHKHDTIAVHLFQKVLIEFLTNKIEKPQKIIYFSDGCAAQYKNRKNFVNLCHHEEDFRISAEWHFFATSHGKGACDGVGGTVKRLAARKSLRRPYSDQILLRNNCLSRRERRDDRHDRRDDRRGDRKGGGGGRDRRN